MVSPILIDTNEEMDVTNTIEKRGDGGTEGPGRGCNEWHKLPFFIPFNLREANGGRERDTDWNVLKDNNLPTSSPLSCVSCILYVLQGTARYMGLLLAPAECFNLCKKKSAFHAVCASFRPFLVFSSNLCNV